MPRAVGLMQAILGGVTHDEAERTLGRCLATGADPLHWCAVTFGRDPADIMHIAAEWAGLRFSRSASAGEALSSPPQHLEQLANVRVTRAVIRGCPTVVAAPDFFGVLRLAGAVQRDPRLAERICLVPAATLQTLMLEASQDALIDSARQTLARVWPYAAAQLDLVRSLRWTFAIAITSLAIVLLLAPLSGQVWLLPIWMLLMLLPTLLRLAALTVPPERPQHYPALPDDELAPYSVLVPLRDEANMVDQLAEHLGALDYPPDRLEIIFVVESRSPETIAAVERHLHDARFRLMVVPDAAPRTKPKALDFALPLCRGEFVVVFDAEDRPDADQLRTVAAQFRSETQVECIQARLNIDNADHGLVPALFAGEYAGLFAVMLPAFARWGAVMPLGGTSNHFRLQTLRQLGGWDAFNVTEDADLGVRLARRHLATATTASATLEEAPTKLRLWMGQRTRWMKGWMQTYVVHNRRSRMLLADLGWARYILFQVTILGMLLAPLLHIGMWPMLVWMQLDTSTTFETMGPWWAACCVVLVLGHGTAMLVNMVGLARIGHNGHWLQQFFLPFYWLLVTWATLLALREFVRRPFHWFKSPHAASLPKHQRPVGQTAPAE